MSANLEERLEPSPADTPEPETELSTATTDEGAAHALLAQADAILRERAADAPEDFAAHLFAGAAAEDLVRYEAPELADLAAASWSFLAERNPGMPKIRVTTAPLADGHRLKDVSVIELVNDDMPFLVNSVTGALSERGLDTHLLVHPVFAVERDPDGALISLSAGGDTPAAARRESVIQIHVDRIDDEAARAALIAALTAVLGDVRHAVEDWRLMVDRVTALIATLKADPPPLPDDEVAEAIAFLEWLRDDNFTFLGVRDYRLEAGGEVLAAVPNSSLGVLRGDDGDVITAEGGKLELSPRAQAAFREPRLLLITKTKARSRVHRRVAMDLVGVKHYGHDGRLTGGFQIVGLFTATAYTRSTRSIPYLRRKVASVLARAGYGPNSHSGAHARQRARHLSARRAVPDRRRHAVPLRVDHPAAQRAAARAGAAALRLVRALRLRPGLCAARALRQRRARAIGRLLATAFDGDIASFVPFFPEGPLVRVHFIITRTDGALAHPDRARLESDVSRLMKTWPDLLLEALAVVHDPIAAARSVRALWRGIFGDLPRRLSSRHRGRDIATIEAMSADAPLGVEFQRGDGRDGGAARLKLWSHGRPLPLSERVPVLEHMGFTVVDESTYHAEPRRPARVAILAARHAARIHRRRCERIRSRPSRGSTTASARSCTETPKTTATTRWCSSPDCRGARWRWCARCRAICARSACPIPRTTCGRPSSSMPASRRGSRRCSRRASIPVSRCRRKSATSARRPL